MWQLKLRLMRIPDTMLFSLGLCMASSPMTWWGKEREGGSDERLSVTFWCLKSNYRERKWHHYIETQTIQTVGYKLCALFLNVE